MTSRDLGTMPDPQLEYSIRDARETISRMYGHMGRAGYALAVGVGALLIGPLFSLGIAVTGPGLLVAGFGALCLSGSAIIKFNAIREAGQLSDEQTRRTRIAQDAISAVAKQAQQLSEAFDAAVSDIRDGLKDTITVRKPLRYKARFSPG